MGNSYKYDVFLSYNWRDHAEVEVVGRALRERGLTVFLDRWYLVPGQPWPQALEGALEACGAVAVFLGPNGMGRWQQREKDLAMSRQANDPTFPVIPILLPGADPALGFLSLNTWIDLREGLEDPLSLTMLMSAVRGEPPGPDLMERVTATLATVCPYRGLRHFREEDAPFFFGREDFSEQLVERVAQQSLVAVVGASGSGKSSVVRAGLLPQLRRGVGERVWDVVTLAPGDRPLHSLAAALLPLLEPEMTETDRLVEIGKLAGHLTQGDVSLRDVVSRALEKQPGTDRLLLVADQWEELYTLSGHEGTRRFVDELLEATTVGSLSVVLTLRGDFFGRALEYRLLADRLQDAVVTLGPMNREELERAVESPAQKVGLTFEPGLVNRILDDVEEEPGSLPLLEFVLTGLWENRREGYLLHDAYESMGEVQGAMAQRAEGIFKPMTPLEQEAARRIFVQLVRPGEWMEDTRRRATFDEIDEAAHPIVRRLADTRLVVTERDEATGEEVVEVAHEALIRNWDRLQSWLDEDREFLLWRQRLREALAGWKRTERDAGSLLRGASLTEAERWLIQRPADLTPGEQNFIRESLRLLRRQRRRRDLGLGAGFMVVLILAGLFSLMWRSAEKQRRIALSRQLAAQALTLMDNQLDLSLLLNLEALRIDDTVEIRSSLLTGLQYSPHLDSFLYKHQSPILSVSFSPDGKTLALGCWDGKIILWDLENRQQLGEPLSGKSSVWSVSFSPDSKLLASGNHSKTITLWDVETRQQLGDPLKGHKSDVRSVAFSPDGKLLASGGTAIILWNVETQKRMGQPISAHKVFSLSFSPDGKLLASGSPDDGGTIILWDVETRHRVGQALRGHNYWVDSVCFSPDGKLLASGSADNTIIFWDVETRKQVGEPLVAHKSAVWSVCFSPDGELLASGSRDNTIILWDVKSRQQIGQPLTGHRNIVWSISFSPDGKLLASGSDDRNVILWDVERKQQIRRQRIGQTLAGHESNVSSVSFSPDGKLLASGSRDNTIILWDVATRQPVGEPLKGHKDYVYSVCFSPDGKLLASGSDDATIILWDVETRQRVGEPLTEHKSWVYSVCFSPDGKLLASAGSDNRVVLWDVETKRQVGQLLTDQREGVYSVCFSPDGKLLASGGMGNTIILWDMESKKQVGKPHTGHKDSVRGISFSPDGKLLASTGLDNAVVLLGVEAKRQVGKPLTGHKDGVFSVCFSPDGKLLASGSRDNTIILWDVETRQPVGKPFIGHKNYVWSVCFSPDGKLLTSGSSDTIIMWDVDLESWQDRAGRMVNRNLTRAEWKQYLGNEPYRKTFPDLPVPGE